MDKDIIEAFKNSPLNGFGSSGYTFDVRDCPCCGKELSFSCAEPGGHCGATYLDSSLSCGMCGYHVSADGTADYEQRKDEDDNWLNPGDPGYKDLNDVDDWENWEYYYEDDIHALVLEVWDYSDNHMRFVCENPEFHITEGNPIDEEKMINDFVDQLTREFPKLPKEIVEYCKDKYENAFYYFDELYQEYEWHDVSNPHIGVYSYDCDGFHIDWIKILFDNYEINKIIKEITDGDEDLETEIENLIDDLDDWLYDNFNSIGDN